MRIGIDCRAILNPERGEAGGVGHYVYQLVRHLLEIDKKNEYTLFFDQRIKKSKLKKFSRDNVKISFYPFFLYSKFVLTPISHHLFDALVQKEKLDVLHFPLLAHCPSRFNVKTVLSVHDLSLLRLPNFFSKHEVEREKNKLSCLLPLVDRIIAVSESTKNDIVDLFKISPEKIKVVYHGLDERFFKKSNPAEIKEVKKRYKIKNNYIFFLSPLETRKNVCRLIQAFDKVKEEIKNNPNKFSNVLRGDQDLQLVLTGKMQSASQKIRHKIYQSPYKKDIILTDYAKPEDLNALFDGAKIFVFPSLYEGFGLPLIEAMAKGVPIITSNLSSMPEIAGDNNAIFINPYRIEEIAQAIIDLLLNHDLRKKIIEGAARRAKEFKWEKTARETLLVYEGLANENP